MATIIREVECRRCGYRWLPRKPGRPEKCASRKCQSPRWDEPKEKRRG